MRSFAAVPALLAVLFAVQPSVSAARARPSPAVRGAGGAAAAAMENTPLAPYIFRVGDGSCMVQDDAGNYYYYSYAKFQHDEIGRTTLSCLYQCGILNSVEDPVVGFQWSPNKCWCLYTNERTDQQPDSDDVNNNCPSGASICSNYPDQRATSPVRNSSGSTLGGKECWAIDDGSMIRDLESDHDDLEGEVDTLQTANGVLESEKAGLEATNSALQTANAALDTENDELKRTRRACRNRRDELREQLDGCTNYNLEQQEEMDELTDEVSALQTDCKCPVCSSADAATVRAAL